IPRPARLDDLGEGFEYRHAGHQRPAPADRLVLCGCSRRRHGGRGARHDTDRRAGARARPERRSAVTAMDRDLVALLGFVGMFALMALRVPIGVAMGIAGVAGFAALTSSGTALNLLSNVPLSVLTDYNLSVIPMFVLMGAFASHSGMSSELFVAGRAWLGHRRGGVALATVAACGGFSAINGSSVA